MAVNEISGFLKFKDANGDTNLLLPITTKDNVDGLDEIENNIDSLNEHAANSNIHFTADERNKLKNIEAGANKTVVDSAVSDTSTNPVQNKVVKEYVDNGLAEKQPKGNYLTTETDPTVPAWAKAEKKPTYTASEVGAVPTTRKVNGKALSSDITLTASDVGALPSTTQIPSIAGLATENYVDNKVAAMVDSAPDTLNTLNELAAALGDDPNFATTVATQIGGKVDKVSGKGLSTNDYTDADKTKLDNTNIAYGTCSTAAATAEKAVVLKGNTQWSLKTGSIIMVKFDVSNTASNVTINVNGTGAYPIWYNNAKYTSTDTAYTGYANRTITYMFNGTHYVWIASSYDANSTYTNAALGQGYATCSTAAATAAKVGSLSSYKLVTGGIVSVKFTNAVPANATLNINSTGAKNIYFRGTKITADVIKAGDVATFIYSSYYHLISIDRWQNDISTLETVASGKADAEHTHDWETIENRPFGEVPGSDTVYWDGNREGLVKADGYDRYMVSPATPTLADFENGASNTKLLSGNESTSNLGMGTSIYEAGDGCIVVGNTIVALKDGATLGDEVYPKKGTYFTWIDNDSYTIRLTINGYTGFLIAKKIDPQWIPDHNHNLGPTPIVTSGDGAEYTVTIDGVTELYNGLQFIMLPHTNSTTASVKLNVNGLGAKLIRQRMGTNTSVGVAGATANWIVANKPITVTYNGSAWMAEIERPDAANLYGTVAVKSGGTGKSTVTSGNFLVGNGTEAMVEKTPDEVLTLINGVSSYDLENMTYEDVGAAPAGCGLGAQYPTNTIIDWNGLNSALKSGWYRVSLSLGGITEWSLRVDSEGDTIYQEFKSTYNGDEVIMHRVYSNGAWSEMEYLNPPLMLGADYRTTERWNGKAVYTTLVDFGELPNTSTKVKESVLPTNITAISATGYAKTATTSKIITGSDVMIEVNNEWGHIVCITRANISGSNAYIAVKYIKN